MADKDISIGLVTRLFYGFIAGFFATLIFHQLTLAALWVCWRSTLRTFLNGSNPALRSAGGILPLSVGRSLGYYICAGR